MYDTVQTKKSLDVSGKWFRWSRYDLLNGVVVPATGAELEEYDPWEQYRLNAGKYRTVAQPYVALLELNRHLKELESREIRTSQPGWHPRYLREPIIGARTEADELILTWCNRHGLLGLVPVLSNSIRPPATIEPGNNECTRVVEKRHYFRDGGSWYPQVVTANPTATTPQAAEDAARRFADEGPKPGVTWLNWRTHVYEEKPLDRIELFFRPVWRKDETFSPPRPNTRQFCEVYGEPIQELTDWCDMFASSVDYISQWDGGKANGEDARAIQQSYWALSGLAQSAAPSFRFKLEKNRLDEARVSAGLLASYALMFLWDRMEKRRALRCQKCGAYFVSNEHRAKYCSTTCRNTAQSRRYRSKKEAIK